jgi:hypothetical protein
MEKSSGLTIILTPAKSEEIFHTALCNALSQFPGWYGITVDYDRNLRDKAKESLSLKGELSPSVEDVMLETLRLGGKLHVIDEEGGGEYSREISLKDIHQWVQSSPRKSLMEMLEGNDDAETADVILQTVFFNDVIFG